MLPQLNASKDNTTMINIFRGLNKGLVIQEGEFSDMKNMTNDYFPVMANRRSRGIMKTLTKPQGVLGGQYLAYVDDSKLYYDDKFICALNQKDVERKMVIVGALLCVFPDGIIYNTNTAEISNISNKTETSGTVTMRMCKLDGTEFTDQNTHIGAEAPEDTEKYPYWLDTSGSVVVLKMYSSTYSMWTSVVTTYVKISAEGIGKGFKAYDAVTFHGIKIKGYNDYDFNQSLIVYETGDDYLIVAGLIDLLYTQESVVTVERKQPDLDYVCELDNRVWGCSSQNHEIYACKLGDPTNWECYAGLDSDSYAATVGSQDDFTGCCAYGGYVYFFKENGFHKLYGNKPSNYEMTWKACRGIQKGCAKSIAIVDEVLFFKARDAIITYDGSETTVSDALGKEPYKEAVAIGYRDKYYISMKDNDDRSHVFVYDLRKGLWCREDDKTFVYATFANNTAHFIDTTNTLYAINEESITAKWYPNDNRKGDLFLYPNSQLFPGNYIAGTLEDTFEWSITTGEIGLDNPYHTYLKRLNVRMQLEAKSKVTFEIEYDSSGTWEHIADYYATRMHSYEIPIRVARADHLKLRISGRGYFRLYSIAKTLEVGSGGDES